jgi:hypothetical protein
MEKATNQKEAQYCKTYKSQAGQILTRINTSIEEVAKLKISNQKILSRPRLIPSGRKSPPRIWWECPFNTVLLNPPWGPQTGGSSSS